MGLWGAGKPLSCSQKKKTIIYDCMFCSSKQLIVILININQCLFTEAQALISDLQLRLGGWCVDG